METIKMTLKSAQNYVRYTKYIVWSEDESEQLQKKLFEIGCRWLHSGKSICHAEHPFLTIDENLNIRYREKNQYIHFEEEKNRFTETHHILEIEIEQEPKQQPKPKFDPKTLQPFDKIMIKDGGVWRCNYFSHIDESNGNYPIICVGSCWRICIPFNDDTKHLLGTTDEAPDFYKLD
jgi:hypothetical protein